MSDLSGELGRQEAVGRSLSRDEEGAGTALPTSQPYDRSCEGQPGHPYRGGGISQIPYRLDRLVTV